MAMDDDLKPMLETLFERIKTETSEFERREHGKPFLPASDGFTKGQFDHYCLDLERLIGCDPNSPDLADDDTALYHASWMHVTGEGLYQDSNLTIRRRSELLGPQNILRSYMGEIRKAVLDLNGNGLLPRYMGNMDTPLQIEPPFLLILYVSGTNADPRVSRPYIVSDIFATIDKSNSARLENFSRAIGQSWEKAFMSLHYATLPHEESAGRIVEGHRERFREIGRRINMGTHPIQTPLGRSFVDAVTLHFQRQWGDREVHLLERSRGEEIVQGRVAHDLSHHLYETIIMLQRARDPRAPSTEAALARMRRYITAAEEIMRTCFAAPWLTRLQSKKDPQGPVWENSRRPTEEDIDILFEQFDGKILRICDAERPLDLGVVLTRRFSVDGIRRGEELRVDLGLSPESWAQRAEPRGDTQMWPLVHQVGESVIAREGKRSLLFGPVSELIRNAVAAAAEMDERAAQLGIEVDIDVATDGSRIIGSVRNGLNFGHDMSGDDQELASKIESMTIGLKATVSAKNNWLEVDWVLNIAGGKERDQGGEAEAPGVLRNR
jgi:hypothetical protein